jgi:hypothetical protein
MIMPPRLRKLALTAHVATTVGWLGAVVVFLALAVVGLTSQDAQTVRGAYLVMEPTAWLVLVPLAFASLLTGIVQALGTPWGLVRHYWVLFKLLITAFATVVLLIYMQTFTFMAGVAADPSADLGVVRNASPRLHATLALLVLLVATVLAVYKPRGMTPYGQRKQSEQGSVVRPDRGSTTSTPRWVKVFGIIALVVVVLFVVLLLVGGGHGPGRHTGGPGDQTPPSSVREHYTPPEGRLGMFVQMTFQVGAGQRRALVPRAAVQSIGNRTVVYVATEDEGRFVETPVTLGALVGDAIQVADGVKPGDKVVTEGSFFVRAEAARVRSSG